MRPCDIVQRPAGTGSVAACSALLGLLTAAAPAHAVATIAADTTRAVLRLRVTDPTIESLQVRTVPAFAEDAATPPILLPSLFAVARVAGAAAGAWAQWDVTSAVAGNGDVNLQVSGPLLDGLEVIEAPPGLGVPGRFVGVYHSNLGGTYVTQVATSDDLREWTHRGDLDAHASQPSIVTVPGGGFVLAVERDTPDAQWVRTSNIVVRHYASWAALAAGAFSAEANLPRSLAPTAEGTPELRVLSWGGTPAASQIEITFHYLKNIQADRQAVGVLTNFDAAAWARRSRRSSTTCSSRSARAATSGTAPTWSSRGAASPCSKRSPCAATSRRGAGTSTTATATRPASWRCTAPAGSFALGNPTVRAFSDDAGATTLFVSGFAFWQGAGFGEAGQFIALRRPG